MSLKLLGDAASKISLVTDPFKIEKLSEIHMHGYSGRYNEWSATVEFKNGSTSGKQSFKVVGFENFGDLVSQIQTFINSL